MYFLFHFTYIFSMIVTARPYIIVKLGVDSIKLYFFVLKVQGHNLLLCNCYCAATTVL